MRLFTPFTRFEISIQAWQPRFCVAPIPTKLLWLRNLYWFTISLWSHNLRNFLVSINILLFTLLLFLLLHGLRLGWNVRSLRLHLHLRFLSSTKISKTLWYNRTTNSKIRWLIIRKTRTLTKYIQRRLNKIKIFLINNVFFWNRITWWILTIH